MPKKSKIGKQRKDKFYHLAKETGYRSRAAFKLIQLNRKFEFLQRSKVCVDLCAAPGGWMQVAVNHMPVASIIVGVDLFPIKPIAGCISFCEDITTPQCLTKLKQELKTWKADIVLHDGAPNVGQNWLHDAYGQNCLTLSAFKLATQILRPGGFFVTKVFRSKDYNALQWVLQQFFKNVYSTKPAASRTESAEIFVVCKGYLAPAQIDPKFLDPKHVFEDIETPDNKMQLKQLLTEVGKKKKAEGYPTGEALLYRPIKASDFLKSVDYVELLANTSKIIIDEDWIAKSEKTTQDIKDHCQDVKVLGRKDIKALVAWRKDLRAKLEQYAKLKSEGVEVVGELADGEGEVVAEEEEEEDEETKLDRAIEEIKDSQKREDRRKKRKVLKERRKLHEKTNLKMIIPGDIGPTDVSEDTLFSLKSVKSNAEVDLLTEEPQLPFVPEEPDLTFEEEVDQFIKKQKAKKVSFNKSEEVLDSSGRFYRKADTEPEDMNGADDSDSSEDPDLEAGLNLRNDSHHHEDSDEELEFEEEPMEDDHDHPLITDLDYSSKDLKRIRKAEMWFDKPIFNGLADESDEEVEINKLAESYISRGADVLGFESKVAPKSKESTDDSPVVKKKDKKKKKQARDDEDKLDLEFEAPTPKKFKKAKKLDAEGLALGTMLVQSKKTKRDILDDGWNRYAFNDDGLPDWFVSDEKKHMKKSVPIPAELVDSYKKNLTEINARPIKKVMEAKARQKKRAIRKMEKAKKKAEAILDKSDMTETEKANQIKQVYKKAQQTKKKEVTYVVAKKHTSGKRMKRPAGVKGPYKVVDARMKKDLRKMKEQGKGGGGRGGKGRGKSASRGKGRGGRGGRR